eukprot:3941296-Rhodomonas_salina.4
MGARAVFADERLQRQIVQSCRQARSLSTYGGFDGAYGGNADTDSRNAVTSVAGVLTLMAGVL